VRAADGSVLFQRVLRPGDSYRVPHERGLTLWTGNAGALAIAVDGIPAAPLRAPAGVLRNVALDPLALLAGKASGG
jgi:cytoskeleton protein RodZ